MVKRFAIISKDGKFYLADKKSEVRQEMMQETVGGKIAWVSTSNRRALIPNDQLWGISQCLKPNLIDLKLEINH